MKLLIIGASRGIGAALREEALAEGHQVTAMARNTSRIGAAAALQVVEGDARDPDSVRQAAAGQDIVCSCIGVPITVRKVDLFSTTAANMVAAATENPGQKLIAITGIGAGDSRGHGGFLYDKIFNPLLLKTIYADKDREEAIISASAGEWLIVRPAGLTNGPRTGSYRVINDLTGVVMKRISRRDVADFILTQMRFPTQFGKTPLLTY